MPYWKPYYHFVWGTKERLPLIEPGLEADLYRVIAAKVKHYDSIVHAIGGTQDHVHLAVSIPPKIALSEFMAGSKGIALISSTT
jgi:putative transposase